MLRILAVDKNGRIYLPEDIRRNFHMARQEHVSAHCIDGELVLRAYKPACAYCGSKRNVTQHNQTNFCAACLAKLSGEESAPKKSVPQKSAP